MKNENNQSTNPITEENEVEQSNDERIDQDFEGFPHAPANEEMIKPETTNEKLTADVEKNAQTQATGENSSDGSGGAFESTERVSDDDNDVTRIDEK
ncbi:hypothetical protein I5907_15420 [Panacibacter sp. DH6]|uniref:Uncharacterized protein n=1 Tax=Panacibacter microcysteis TaxID=2793269 RepID=A0A931E9H1_9BACT|nr:hypothetical protein [Panacibacter microcysteis]MBG9377633.1 hypothetical protein [Panacibacter microcysteis]